MLKRLANIARAVNANHLYLMLCIYAFLALLTWGLSLHYFFYTSDAETVAEKATSVLTPLELHDKLNKLESLIKHGSHGKSDEPVVEKILVVISLTCLWFITFVTAAAYKAKYPNEQAPPAETAADKRLEEVHLPVSHSWDKPFWVKIFLAVFAISPAVFFVRSMLDAYEPAVFVMALVAIFMAAEHYAGLAETEEKLEKTGGSLERKTRELGSTMDRVLDADGLASWRNEVYELYKKAERRVDAVIRYYDIDAEWWQCVGPAEPWSAYKAKAKKNPYSLLAALDKSKAKVQFVSNLPLPQFYTSSASAGLRGQLFRNFLGLAWHLVVFAKVRKSRAKSCTAEGSRPKYLRIRITHAACWMHVIDAEVFQVIERGTEGNSTVRELTRSMHDKSAKGSLAGWARHSVRQFAHRGGSGEEYVVSVLRYALFHVGKELDAEADVTFHTLEKLLNVLGMQEFIEMPKPDFLLDSSERERSRDASSKADETNPSKLLSSADARRLCVRVFEKLIQQRFELGICAVGVQPRHPGKPRLSDLACEIL